MTPVPLSSRSMYDLGMYLVHSSPLVDEFTAHTNDQLHHLDGYGAGGSYGVPRGEAEMTPTEAAANARFVLGANREEVRDTLTEVNALARTLVRQLRDGLRHRAPTGDEERTTPRCTGGEPDCTNVPSTHTLASGALHDALCDHCWSIACHVCGKPRDEQRRVDDRQACGACWKRHLRARGRAA